MNLLLDLDGTLTDPKLGIVRCMHHALTELGRDPNDFPNLDRFIGPPLLASFEELLGSEHAAQLALAHYRERFSDVGLFENEVYAGIVDCLIELREAGHRLCVATSKPQVFAQRIVEHFELAVHFDTVFGSELDGVRTDKSELIAYALECEGWESSATVMIGDRSFDVRGARANGVGPIGVLWGYGSREELVSAGADALCTEPRALPGCLR